MTEIIAKLSPINTMFLFFMVESFFMSIIGMGLIGIRLGIRQYLTIGIIHGFFVYVIRNIYLLNEIPFGTHTIILLLIMIILIHYVGKLSWGEAAVAGFVGIAIMLINEAIVIVPFYGYFNLKFAAVMNDRWLSVASGNAVDLPIYILGILIYKLEWSLVKIKSEKFI